LDDPGAVPAVAGGKGASLARLARAGFRVPPGFHVTTGAYLDFVGQGGLREPMLAALSAVDVSDAATADAAACPWSRPGRSPPRLLAPPPGPPNLLLAPPPGPPNPACSAKYRRLGPDLEPFFGQLIVARFADKVIWPFSGGLGSVGLV
jgi:Pyruvate phosphate dikinase, AMP/ATP-binding domain